MNALRRCNAIPPGLLAAEPQDLLELLGGPTLLHLPGARKEALFVSTLLHGNETSSWHGLRRLLRESPALPRDLLIFIGNVEAAAQGLRSLPGQQDFNRMWNPPSRIARQVLDCAAGLPLFAVADLHNNTGRNPHYAVLTDLAPGSLGLAGRFGDTAVYIEEPDTVLARAFADRAPSITLELGPVSDPGALYRAYDFLSDILRLERIPAGAAGASGLTRLYRALARVRVADGVAFGFADLSGTAEAGNGGSDDGEPPAPEERLNPTRDAAAWEANAEQGRWQPEEQLDLVLDAAVEASNFARLPEGTNFGIARNGSARGLLKVLGNDLQDATDAFFAVRDRRIVLKTSAIPAMYSTDVRVVRQDCLCYFMAPLHPGAQEAADGAAASGKPAPQP